MRALPILVVLLVILVCVLAALLLFAVSKNGVQEKSPGPISGGGLHTIDKLDAPPCSIHGGGADYSIEEIREMLDESKAAFHSIRGGGVKVSKKQTAKKKTTRKFGDSWTGTKTWNEIETDVSLVNDYLDDRIVMLKNISVGPFPDKKDSFRRKGIKEGESECDEIMTIDWGKLHKELLPCVHDDAEWAGNVSLVRSGDKYIPKVIFKEKSPIKNKAIKRISGLGGTSSPDLFKKVHAIPSMWTFHTHPLGSDDPSNCFSLGPSGTDYASAISAGVTGRYAGDLLISELGIVAYGLYPYVMRMMLANLTPDFVLSQHRLQTHIVLDQRFMDPHTFKQKVDYAKMFGLYTCLIYETPLARKCEGDTGRINYFAYDWCESVDKSKDLCAAQKKALELIDGALKENPSPRIKEIYDENVSYANWVTS